MDSDLIRGNVDTIILKCLERGAMYGVEICTFVREASGGTFTLKPPTLYSALKRLKDNKLVSSYWEDSAIGGRRHYYKLTEAGLNTLGDKKNDWLFSKLLIDNLVLDKQAKEETAAKEIEMPVTLPQAAAQNISTVPAMEEQKTSETAAAAFAPAEQQETRVIVTARPITPLEKYVAASGDYITVPLTHSRPDAVEVKPYILGDYNAPAAPAAEIAKQPTQLKINIPKPLPVVNINPFVKHAKDRRNGKFVLYNKLRLACSALVCTVLAVALACSWTFIKSSHAYTVEENTFFALGLVASIVYLLVNVALFTAYPRHKRVITSRARDLARRAALTVCISVAAVSINIIAGLTAVNAADFVVFWVVPCVLSTAIFIEGMAIWAFRKNRFFLT